MNQIDAIPLVLLAFALILLTAALALNMLKRAINRALHWLADAIIARADK